MWRLRFLDAASHKYCKTRLTQVWDILILCVCGITHTLWFCLSYFFFFWPAAPYSMLFTRRITLFTYFNFDLNSTGLPASCPPSISSAVWSFNASPFLLRGRVCAPHISEVATNITSSSWDNSVCWPYLGFDATFIEVILLAGLTAPSMMNFLRWQTSVVPRDVAIHMSVQCMAN